MLDRIIEIENDKMEEECLLNGDNKIKLVEKNIDELLKKIEDEEIYNELDNLIGEIGAAYRDACFKIGFKKGIKLGFELKSEIIK